MRQLLNLIALFAFLLSLDSQAGSITKSFLALMKKIDKAAAAGRLGAKADLKATYSLERAGILRSRESYELVDNLSIRRIEVAEEAVSRVEARVQAANYFTTLPVKTMDLNSLFVRTAISRSEYLNLSAIKGRVLGISVEKRKGSPALSLIYGFRLTRENFEKLNRGAAEAFPDVYPYSIDRLRPFFSPRLSNDLWLKLSDEIEVALSRLGIPQSAVPRFTPGALGHFEWGLQDGGYFMGVNLDQILPEKITRAELSRVLDLLETN